MGLNRNMPKEVLYGPQEYGGLSFPTIETVQDQKGISHWIKHLRWGKEIGDDFKILLSAAQLTSGLTVPILDDVDIELPYLEEGVISHLRSTLKKLHGSIHIENVWTPQLQREGDRSLMEAFAQHEPKIQPGYLKAANTCQLFVRVVTIAELANIDGTTIDTERLEGKWRAESNLIWPRQCAPTPDQWRKFKSCLRRTFCKGNRSQYMPFDLTTPLGVWHQVPRHIQYHAYRDEMRVYCVQRYESELEDNSTPKYRVYDMRILEGETDFEKTDEEIETLPNIIHPTEVQHVEGNLVESQNKYDITHEEQQEEEPYFETENKRNLECADKLIVASNGSHDPESSKAAFAWTITTEDRSGYIQGAKPVRAHPRNMTSYRAELAGIQEALKILKKENLQEKTIEMGCDNKGAINKTVSPYLNLDDMTAAEGDLIKVITDTLTNFPNITLKHV